MFVDFRRETFFLDTRPCQKPAAAGTRALPPANTIKIGDGNQNQAAMAALPDKVADKYQSPALARAFCALRSNSSWMEGFNCAALSAQTDEDVSAAAGESGAHSRHNACPQHMHTPIAAIELCRWHFI
ncbi:MAG: hypothetical protein P4N60_02395 [Verrucomicrobiae bacterium]|nr:hypothetical protein [Verrucomicrobiae bacterium]